MSYSTQSSQKHNNTFSTRQWLESLSRYELEARQPLDDNLKIATLVSGLRGNLQQHLLLSVETDFYLAKCERDSRELLQFNFRSQSYYRPHCLPSSWLTRRAGELPQTKAKRKRKRRQRQERRQPLQRKRKEQRKREARRVQQRKRKGDNKGGKGHYQGLNSWNQGGSRYYNKSSKRKRKRRKDECYYAVPNLQKAGDMYIVAANCWYKDFYLHYSSSWFRHYWSDTTLQHGSSYQRPTSSTYASRPTTTLQPAWTMHLQQLHASYYCTKSSSLKHCILPHNTRTSPTPHQSCLLRGD